MFFFVFFRTGTISCGMPGSRAVCPDLSFFVRYARKKSMRVVLIFFFFRKINFDLCFFSFFSVLGRFRAVCPDLVRYARISCGMPGFELFRAVCPEKKYACGSNFFFFSKNQF